MVKRRGAPWRYDTKPQGWHPTDMLSGARGLELGPRVINDKSLPNIKERKSLCEAMYFCLRLN